MVEDVLTKRLHMFDPERTILTAHPRTSPGYGETRFVMAPSSQELEPPKIPVRFIEAMNEHLAEIAERVSAGAIAVLMPDGAGWHRSPRLTVPDDIVLLALPPYAPEFNPAENVWEYLRGNLLSHRVWQTYDAILDANRDAWNKLMQMPSRIASVTRREWAKTVNR
ncbi:MAG: transposase [Gemmataceae bacterium]